jgi:hypothetical protein
MDWNNILTQIFELILFPLLIIGSTYLIYFLSVKTKEIKDKTDNDTLDKYLDMLNSTITQCVIATTQTYVSSLKQQGKFDAEAQKIAFQKTYDNVMSILTAESKYYLQTALGDLEAYINNKIEAEVALNK